MMKTTKCDQCNIQLNDSFGFNAWYISLVLNKIPSLATETMDTVTYPPIKSDKDFCSLECLRKWLEKN